MKTFIDIRLIKLIFGLILLSSVFSCSKDKNSSTLIEKSNYITIFTVNDVHAQIDNFSKIKYIVDKERENNEVILVSAGDLFSGNPVVDNHEEKGYPIIDLMNILQFDVSAIGNHEFDYGQEVLKNRINQAEFEFLCANMNTDNSLLNQPLAYTTINTKTKKVTFLSLLETYGKADDIIPSTHPAKLGGIAFYKAQDIVQNYSSIKEQEGSDLYIALTHLGMNYPNGFGDVQLASQHPYFDLIIGGHSHTLDYINSNNIPIVQAGSYLNYLGKIRIKVENKAITSLNWEAIDLNSFSEKDKDIEEIISAYNYAPYLNEVIGYASSYHSKSQLGCFYTDAIRIAMQVDVSFQNTGGIRADLDEGNITTGEIFKISPFNNGTLIFSMSVSEIKDFLEYSQSGFYYSGIKIERSGNELIIKDIYGNKLSDNTNLRVGINDYIPSVHSSLFPDNGVLQDKTAAETLIFYLKNYNSNVNYPNCNNYFKY